MWIEIILSLITIYVIWQILKKPPNLPPGPWGLPLVGYLPFSTINFRRRLKELQKQHGDIVSWRIGTRLIIFLCNYKLTKEAFLGTNFVDRPNLAVFTFLDGTKPLGVVTTNGIHWHSLRRFSLRHLKDLGMGKSKFTSSVHFEATELVREMKKVVGKATPIPYALHVSILNVIWLLVADRRYSVEEKELIEFEELVRDIQENVSRRSINDFFPWVKYVLPSFLYEKLIKKKAVNEVSNKLGSFFKGIIKEHKKSLDITNPRDYIDAYLIEMENQKSDPDSTMSIDDLTAMVGDLFAAGSETVRTTIQWAIFYMASFQDVQKRLQKEIDQFLPKGTQPTLEDKMKFSYLEAFIHETHRYSCLVPDGVVHESSEDITFGGYLIPKGTFITHSTSLIHFDPRYFKSPNEFRPERFLDNEGKFVNPKEGLVTFGVGKRQCLGEALARMELFIFLSTLIQNFNFSSPPGKKLNLNPLENPLLNFPLVEQEILITER